jgi:hypothetical protein
MTGLYPYAAPRADAAVEHYRHSPFHGHAFFAAWLSTRQAALPAPRAGDDSAACPTQRRISRWHAALLAGGPSETELREVEALMRNYEAKKRIFADYNPGFTSKGRTDYAPLSCWLAFAAVLFLMAERTGALPFLNAGLKINDTLLARAGELTAAEQHRLRQNLDHELRLVEVLARSLGVEIR